MFHSSKQRGFTLIELLVVIAIIGILAAVVLASLNDARNSGNDASAQTSMTNLRSQSEVFYNNNDFSYDDVCADPEAANLLAAAGAQTGTTPLCAANDTGFGAEVTLRNGDVFCVDSTGFAGSVAATTIDDASDDVTCN